jgi:cell cycle checkpoint protein
MSALIAISEETPIFKAVSSSARQLFQLLNCINFASKVQLELSEDGVRFFVEEARIMQGRKTSTSLYYACTEKK